MAVGVRLTGASGEYISLSSISPSVSTGCDIICLAALDDWSSGWIFTYAGYTSNRAVRFGTTAGDFYVVTSDDGTSSIVSQTTVAHGISNGDPQWVRVKVVPGSPDGTAHFYKGGSGETPSWSLHESVTATGLTTLNSPASQLIYVGTVNATTGNTAGEFYQCEFWEGDSESGGTLVAEWSAPHTGSRYRDSTGKVWTLNGSAYSTVITA